MPKRYTVTDGRLVLVLLRAPEGGYTVTSPMDPELITQADSLEEAFVMAYDAKQCLAEARASRARRLVSSSSLAKAGRRSPRTVGAKSAAKSAPRGRRATSIG
jgi:antitoxin HicB